MMNPFVATLQPGAVAATTEPGKSADSKAAGAPDLDDLKKQIAEMQRQIEGLARKS